MTRAERVAMVEHQRSGADQHGWTRPLVGQCLR